MPAKLDLYEFTQQGYVILDVLTPADCDAFRAAADAMMAEPRFSRDLKFHYLCFILPAYANAKLQESFQHPGLTSVAEAILGPGLVLDNAALLAAEPGVSYRQGWHRDVLQVPENLVTDEMFSPDWKHNNLQLNLSLADDDAFWAVPGSHHRPNTPEEASAFGGSRHLTPVEARMPGAQCIRLRPGQAAFYNNNLIHRGYCDFTSPRRTLHIGYHYARRPPTWHFYNFGEQAFGPEYVATLAPGARKWVEAMVAERKRWPDVKASYRSGLVGAHR